MKHDELDALSSEELHDRAMAVARRHLDAGFLWDLITAVPTAQAAAGQLDDAEVDIVSLTSLLTDALRSGEGDLAEALRPLYIDYLAKRS